MVDTEDLTSLSNKFESKIEIKLSRASADSFLYLEKDFLIPFSQWTPIF